MDGIGKKIEITANIAIIFVAIMIGVVLVSKYYLAPKSSALPKNKTVPVGTKLVVPDIDWAKNGHTLVLALNEGCRFCSESAPFYKRLVTEAIGKNIQLVAAFPHPVVTGKKYLENLGVKISDTRQMDFKSIGVSGTPTLLLADSEGKVTASWVGKLQPEKESEVIAQFR